MNGPRTFGVTAAFLFLIVAVVLVSFAAEKGDPKAGKTRYESLCGSCHGMKGKGDGPAGAALPVKPKDMTDGKRVNPLADQYLFDIIKKGGTGMGKSPLMPAWGGQLSDQDIWNVVAFIRSLAIPQYKAAEK